MSNPKQERYTLAHTNDPQFLADIERIYQDNLDEDVLVIPCSDEEFEQFNFG